MVAGLLSDPHFDGMDLALQYIEKLGVDLDAGADHRVVELICDPLSIHRSIDTLLKCRHVVLVTGVLDVAQQLSMFVNQVHPTAKKISSGSHFPGVRIGLWQHSTAQKLRDLLAVDSIVLYLPAMDRLHVEGMTQYEGDSQPGAEIGNPVPDEYAFDRDGQVLSVRIDHPGE